MKSTPLAADYHPVEVLWEDEDLIAGQQLPSLARSRAFSGSLLHGLCLKGQH